MNSFRKSSLLMIGSFGFGKSTYGGEDVKNRLLFKYLNKLGYKVNAFDTSGWRGNAITIIFKILFRTTKDRENIFLCSHAIGAIRVLPYLVLYKILFRRKVIYMVVGFAINYYLDKYPILARLLRNIDGIIVETEMHKNFLYSKGLSNVVHINNFRDIENEKKKAINHSRMEQLEIIYFTRIDFRKPIDSATKIFDLIKEYNLQKRYKLNIYGKLHKDYEETFFLKISDYSNIKYHGTIHADQILSTLMEHDVMIYPLSAKEDVFPGVLLDAFGAKLPVIAMDSNYISEIIRDNINGFLINPDDNEAWLERLEKIRNMSDAEYHALSDSTYKNSLQFDRKVVLENFASFLVKQEVL